MELTEMRKGNALIISMRGRFDSSSALSVENRMRERLGPDTHALIFDCAGLEYISSAGIRVLVHCTKELEKQHGSILLAAVPKPIENVLYITGFLSYFTLFDSVDKALIHLED